MTSVEMDPAWGVVHFNDAEFPDGHRPSGERYRSRGRFGGEDIGRICWRVLRTLAKHGDRMTVRMERMIGLGRLVA